MIPALTKGVLSLPWMRITVDLLIFILQWMSYFSLVVVDISVSLSKDKEQIEKTSLWTWVQNRQNIIQLCYWLSGWLFVRIVHVGYEEWIQQEVEITSACVLLHVSPHSPEPHDLLSIVETITIIDLHSQNFLPNLDGRHPESVTAYFHSDSLQQGEMF